MMENYMVILFSVRENEPLWRNWQTHLTQNQAGNTVPVRVRPAAAKPFLDLYKKGFIFCTETTTLTISTNKWIHDIYRIALYKCFYICNCNIHDSLTRCLCRP